MRQTRVVERDLVFQLRRFAQVHQNLVFNAPRSIRRKLDIALHAERIYRFDEPDGADGNEVFHVHGWKN